MFSWLIVICRLVIFFGLCSSGLFIMWMMCVVSVVLLLIILFRVWMLIFGFFVVLWICRVILGRVGSISLF